MDPTAPFEDGVAILAPFMASHGFTWQPGLRGKGSGGPFASGVFRNGDRVLSLSFRRSLGLVSYQIGDVNLAHEVYMRALVPQGKYPRYPGFSDDPLDGFRHLLEDLACYGNDFLDGDGHAFHACHRLRKRQAGRLPK